MEELRKTGVFIQGYNTVDVTSFVSRMNKKFSAVLLSQLEELIDDPVVYSKIRKAVLDSFNNYTRSIVNTIFGEIN
jgi:hypothetical protein